MQIYFLNADGKERIDFNGHTYSIADMDIFKHQWSYETKDEKITKFKRELLEKEIEINISDDRKGSWQEHYAYIQDVFDKDNLNNQRGKLYVNGYYLLCNVYAGETEDQFRNWCDFQTCALKIISDRPIWIKESLFSFLPYKKKQDENEKIPEREYAEEQRSFISNNATLQDFPFDFVKSKKKKQKPGMFDYPFDYVGVYGRRVLKNTAFTDSDFIMTIYGFAQNPSVLINGHPYTINTIVYDGERIVINSAAGSVKKIGRMGEVEDIYNAREKKFSVFKKIPAGVNTVNWSGGFGFDITIIEERSEPKWNL